MNSPLRSRIPLRSIFLSCVLTLCAVGIAPSAQAAPEDGAVQPGDRFGGSGYCTAGPSFENYVFSAAHCSPMGGSASELYSGVLNSNPLSDWRLSQVPQAPSTITTWTSCPSVRVYDSDPVTVAPCQQGGGDIPIAGVVQPWPGMVVEKSGATSGVSTGVLTQMWPDWPSVVDGMYHCRGDSGAPLYTKIGGKAYFVGMVNWGSGSIDDSRAGRVNGDAKACYRTTYNNDLEANGLMIDQLCAKLPGDASQRCYDQSHAPKGDITSVQQSGQSAVVHGIAFDPNTAPHTPLSSFGISVNGANWQTASISREYVDAASYQLDSNMQWGFGIQVDGLPDGANELCIDLLNEPGTPGSSTRLPCSTVYVCQGQPANPIHGTNGDDVLVGTSGVDAVYGYEGDDKVEAGTGNDCLYGGAGNDLLLGQGGDDLLNGDDGDDKLFGGNGLDDLRESRGNDRLVPDGIPSLEDLGELPEQPEVSISDIPLRGDIDVPQPELERQQQEQQQIQAPPEGSDDAERADTTTRPAQPDTSNDQGEADANEAGPAPEETGLTNLVAELIVLGARTGYDT